MKYVITVTVLTAIIIIAGVLTLNMLNTESEVLYNKLDRLEEDIKAHSWQKASDALKSFHKKWDRNSEYWSMLIDHYEIDSIEQELSQLSSFIETEDESNALARLSSLKALIKHIPNKEAFKLKNIL